MTGRAKRGDAGEVIRFGDGREAVRFTTPSGVRAVVDTSISQEALAKFSRSLKAKLARRARLSTMRRAVER